jgi:hypothetical protein
MAPSRALSLLCLLACAAPAARGATYAWNGTLAIELQNRTPLEVAGGGSATLDVPAVPFTLTLGPGIAGSATIPGVATPTTDPVFGLPVTSVRVEVSNLSGALGPISGTAPLTQRVAPVSGLLRVCIFFPGCDSAVEFPLSEAGTRGVGAGGIVTVNGFSKGISFSLVAAPWTVGTALVTGVTSVGGGTSTAVASGFAHGPVSASTSAADAGAELQLVAPALIQSDFGSAGALVSTLRLHFVPEPAPLALLGSGVALLLGLARRRAR